MNIAVCLPTHNEPTCLVQRVTAETRALIGDHGHICAYHDAEGRGKGHALRMALRAAKVYNPDYYIFIDGDGDISPQWIPLILNRLLLGADVVVGKKALPIRWDRKILTFASRLWIRMLFGIEVDTQTGIKGFNYAPEWKTDGWAFDIEVLYKAKLAGKTMEQVSVHATVSSGKSWRDILTTLIDTIRIRNDKSINHSA